MYSIDSQTNKFWIYTLSENILIKQSTALLLRGVMFAFLFLSKVYFARTQQNFILGLKKTNMTAFSIGYFVVFYLYTDDL